MSNVGDISIREFIRWLPGEAEEATSTIVLSSPQKRFVDVRVLLPTDLDANKQHDDGSVTNVLPLDRLDWAIAGQSTSEHGEDGTRHAVFHHWIDSRTSDTETLADEGIMYPRGDGKELEKGHMVNPATGLDTEYEELWADVAVMPIPDSRVQYVVLEMERDPARPDERGMAVRVGQYCQALMRRGDEISVERWEWEAAGGWRETVRFGNAIKACRLALELDGSLGKDDYEIDGRVWNIIEMG